MIMTGSRLGFAAVWAVLSALVLVFLCRTTAMLPLSVPIDPNEGWNAYHALSAWGRLYPPAESYLVNNYPPLSFYLVAGIGKFTGDLIVAGRILSLLSLLAICTCVFHLARVMGAARTEAAFGAVFFAAVLLIFTDYVGMNDPQLLAHAVCLGGFCIIIRKRSKTRLFLAAFCFTAAFFIKHNVVVLPLAAFFWLLLQERGAALRLALSGIAMTLVGMVLFWLAYGVSLLSVFSSARSYAADLMSAGVASWLRFSVVPLFALSLLLLFRLRETWVVFCGLYAVCGIAVGVYFLGGAGVDANALFDADIALALTVALALNRLPLRAVLATALLVPLLWGGWRHISDYGREDFFSPARVVRQARADISLMKLHEGPALCAMLSFCYWSGKGPAVDFFNTGEAFATGTRRDDELVARISGGAYGVIQFDPDSEDALGPRVQQAVWTRYRLDHRDDFGSFYVLK